MLNESEESFPNNLAIIWEMSSKTVYITMLQWHCHCELSDNSSILSGTGPVFLNYSESPLGVFVRLLALELVEYEDSWAADFKILGHHI